MLKQAQINLESKQIMGTKEKLELYVKLCVYTYKHMFFDSAH